MKRYLVLPLDGKSYDNHPTPAISVRDGATSATLAMALEDFLNVMSINWDLVTIHYNSSIVHPLAVFTERQDI